MQEKLGKYVTRLSQMVRHCAENTVEKDANRPPIIFWPSIPQ